MPTPAVCQFWSWRCLLFCPMCQTSAHSNSMLYRVQVILSFLPMTGASSTSNSECGAVVRQIAAPAPLICVSAGKCLDSNITLFTVDRLELFLLRDSSAQSAAKRSSRVGHSVRPNDNNPTSTHCDSLSIVSMTAIYL